ncbi:hypothetical protein GC173_08390 [bacterium]|nr:hypothetical protein [bacterium]
MTTILGQMLVPPALVLGLAVATAQIPAQTTGQKTSQTDKKSTSGADKAKELIKQARTELKKNQFSAARETVAKARTADPKNPDLAKVEAEIAAAEKKAAAEKVSDQIDRLLDQADASRKAGKYDDALAKVGEALALNPKESEALKLRDRIQKEKTAALEKSVESAVKARIKAADDAIKLNNFELARRQEAEARTAAKGGFKSDLDSLAARIAKAESAYNAKRNEAQIKKLLATSEDQLKNNQFELARATANSVLQLDRQNRDASKLLSKIAAEEKEFAANRVQREAAEEVRKADALAKAGKTEEAIAAYKAILTKDPKSSAAQSGLKKAQSALAEQREDQAEALIAQGEAALKAKNYELAAQKAAEAKAIAPELSDVSKLERSIASAKAASVASASKQVATATPKAPDAKALAKEAEAKKEAEAAAAKAKAEADKKKAAEEAKAAELKKKADEAAAKEKAEADKKKAEADAKAAELKKKADEAAAKEKAEADKKKAEAAAKLKAEEEKAAAAAASLAAKEAAEKAKASAKSAQAAVAVTPSPTPTVKPTATPKPTPTVKPTPTPKPTKTPKPIKTPKPTPTPKPTKTPKPTPTLKPTPTPKVTPTPKATPVVTPVPTVVSTPAATPVATMTVVAPEATPLSPFVQPADTTNTRTPDMTTPVANAEATPLSPFLEPAGTPAPTPKAAAATPTPKATSTPKPTPTPKAASTPKPTPTPDLARQAEAQQQERRRRAESAYDEGVALYRQGELARARQRWADAKDIDPSFLKADSYLQNTEAEYNAFLAKQQDRKGFEAREAAALDKMNQPITFSTLDATSLTDFLSNLRLLTGSDGLNFVVIGEVKAKVEAAFDNQPLNKVLDETLLPMGLRWEREPGTNTVRIMPDLRTEVFTVLPDQLNTIESLIQQGVIPRLLYGMEGTPVLQGQEILVDPRSNIVILTDSEANLTKFRRFVEGLTGTVGTQLIFKSFEVDETKGPQIKSLLDAILAVDNNAPYSSETKLILEGGTLIIRDTPENIQKVEQLLQDQNFMKNFYSDKLSVATFNLTPIIEFDENREMVDAFADQVRQVVETLLYAREGRSKAEREGRRIWYDYATLQLTITDYPDRLAAVQDYIESLPQIRSRKRSKIIFLDWAAAGDLVGDIESFLGIDASAGQSSAATGNQVTKTLRTEQTLEFNGATFRVSRVNENDAADDNDDSVEMIVSTNTTSQDLTIEEFRSEFVDDFRVEAEDVKPSSTPGEGRARLKITYTPGGGGGSTGEDGVGGGGGNVGTGDAAQTAQDAASQRAQLREESGFSIVPIENLNAIFIQYENAEQLRDVEFWVKTLDIPVLQVSLEIKFVEVASNKSKEWKPEFNIGDLTDISISDDVLRSRFANDRDEYGSAFEPLNESSDSANLLKGTTVFNYIVSSGNSPISLTLQMLESQGVINVVNGPTITVLNQQSADFTITREFGIRQPTAGSTGSDSSNLTAVASLTPIQLTIEPTVTRAGNITLDIDVDAYDFDQNLGQTSALGGTTTNTGTDAATTTATSSQQGIVNAGAGVLRKEITTNARIKDGGTVVLGGWRNERIQDLESGIPILRDIPFIGKLLFNRTQKDESKITLLIFLTGQVIRD